MIGSPVGPRRHYRCGWCGHAGEGTELTCPACGAAVDVREVVTDSGWVELPGIKDMARLQFGRSYCQIEGKYVPVADMSLSPEDSVYFSHHVLLWKEPQVDVSAMSLKGAWKRLFAGMPLIMTLARGPGHIAFSRDEPGEMVAVPLQPGQAADVREHCFLGGQGRSRTIGFRLAYGFRHGQGMSERRTTRWACSWTGSFASKSQACCYCIRLEIVSCAPSHRARPF